MFKLFHGIFYSKFLPNNTLEIDEHMFLKPPLLSLFGWIPLIFSIILANLSLISACFFLLFQPSSPNSWWETTSYSVILLDMMKIYSETKLISIAHTWLTNIVRFLYYHFTDKASWLWVTESLVTLHFPWLQGSVSSMCWSLWPQKPVCTVYIYIGCSV